MKVSEKIECIEFPCSDVDVATHIVPYGEVDPLSTQLFMITEAPPHDRKDYFYAEGHPFYLQTTIQAFNDAGIKVATVQDILDRGVYITTAIKCGKAKYAVSTSTVRNCSLILESEMSLFPNIRAFLLMGDIAIKAMNYIWKRRIGRKIVPGGSTYKIRNQKYYWGEKRVFPSYTPTGKNYLIEKSKRKMISEDIGEAMRLIRST